MPTNPVPGHSITYPYGSKHARYASGYHTGDDYFASMGTPVVAVRSGKIVKADNTGGAYGNWIQLLADNGHLYMYAHLSAIDVTVGQVVNEGHSIGKVGTSGTKSTGPHLHFEDHPSGTFVYGKEQKPDVNASNSGTGGTNVTPIASLTGGLGDALKGVNEFFQSLLSVAFWVRILQGLLGLSLLIAGTALILKKELIPSVT